MTSESIYQPEVEIKSKIIKDLYLALFTQNALRNVSRSLAGIYMDADISGESIRWEDTAACPILQLITKLQKFRSELLVCDANTLHAYSNFVQLKVGESVECTGSLGRLNAKWLPEILIKCQEVATKACLPMVNDTCLGVNSIHGLCGLQQLVADVYCSMENRELLSLKIHFEIAQAFAIKAIKLFTSRVQEMHKPPELAGFSFFDKLNEFAPLIWVASTVYELAADSDIASFEALNSYIAQIRRQFSAINELDREAKEQCGQMLELSLSDSLAAGKNALARHFEVM